MNPGPPKLNSGGPPKWSPKLHSPKDFGAPRAGPHSGCLFCIMENSQEADIMCVFCDIINKKIPSKVVYEDDKVIAILDLSQLTYGHTLVMPKKHVDNFLEADPETVSYCALVTQKLARQIVKNTGAKGANIVTNAGAAAGQSVNHLHFHIIPRYDENDGFGFRETPHENLDLDEVLKTITK